MGATPQTTDALLMKATLPSGAAKQMSTFLPAMLHRLRSALPGSAVQVHVAFSAAHRVLYAYLHLAEPALLEPTAAASLEAALKREWPHLHNLQVSRLEKVLDKTGASAGTAPVFHYVVEMDPETGWMPQLAEWYDAEHMPGLATVPGCVRASRFLNHDHGPLSLACYDLVTEDTLGSAAWLAVRETEWSSRMRPHFTNTVRTMFDLAADAGLATAQN